jgi:hypothetical protein
MASELVRTMDESLKQCKKSWKQVLSLRIFFYEEMFGQDCTHLIASEILKRSNCIPSMTVVPVCALSPQGNGIIACALQVL